MRYWLYALLFGSLLFAQDSSSPTPSDAAEGAFYVDGIVYHYVAGRDYTVVAAAHSVLNHKFLAVKIRVYNGGRHSITLKPEDVAVEDAVAGHAVAAISGEEMAKRLRKPYNMARYGVNAVAGSEPEGPITSDMVTPQFMEMMRAMAARANGGGMPGGSNVLYTDTPGALDDDSDGARPASCDRVCHLRLREAQTTDALAQLQKQISPESVEQYALLANTIPPRGNVGGVLYFQLGKVAESADVPAHGKKGRLVRMVVPVGGERFQFEMPVE